MPKLNFEKFDDRLATTPSGFPAARFGSVESVDRIKLAYAIFEPDGVPDDVLVFYHGGGANMRAGYDRLAAAVAAKAPVAVCLADMRGHGASGGRRGHAARPEAAWRDVDAICATVRRLYPTARLHLGGHSSAAGLLVNALSHGWPRVPVASLALLAPNFGYHANLERTDAQFGAASFWPFVVNWFSGGRLAGGVPAVFLDFSASRMARAAGCVTRYSVNMALAVTPSAPGSQLAGIGVPIWVGLAGDDEIIDPTKTAEFLARHAPGCRIEHLPGCGHLSVILDGGPKLAAALAAGSGPGGPAAADRTATARASDREEFLT